MIGLVSPIGWMAIGAGGLVALACVAIVIAGVVASFKKNPVRKSFDTDDVIKSDAADPHDMGVRRVFNSDPEEKQDK